jgi:hypothetical protein
MRAAPLAVCLGIALLANTAHGADAPLSEANMRMAEGKELAQEGRYEEARVKFTEACAVLRGFGCLRSLAAAELYSGHFIGAYDHFREAIRDPAWSSAPSDVRGKIEQLQREAYQHTAHVVIVAPANAAIFADGTLLGTAPLPSDITMTPGSHVIEIRGPEQKAAKQIDTVEGQLARVEIVFPGEASARPAPTTRAATTAPAPSPTQTPSPGPGEERRTDPRPSFWSGRIVPTIVLGGVAVAGLLSGIAFTVAASSKRTDEETYRAEFPQGVCLDPSSASCAKYQSTLDDEHRDRVIAVTAFAVAGLAAVSAGCVFFWPRSNRAGTSPWIRPHIGGRAASVQVGGTF